LLIEGKGDVRVHDKIELLERLTAMWKGGTLSEAEFAAEKQRWFAKVAQHSAHDEWRHSRGLATRFSEVPVLFWLLISAALLGTAGYTLRGSNHAVTANDATVAARPARPEKPRSQPVQRNDEEAWNNVQKIGVCMLAESWFTTGDGMRSLAQVSPDLARMMYDRLPVMGRQVDAARAAISKTMPSVPAEELIGEQNSRLAGSINSQQVLTQAKAALDCSVWLDAKFG
jgi:hypothetical protein